MSRASTSIRYASRPGGLSDFPYPARTRPDQASRSTTQAPRWCFRATSSRTRQTSPRARRTPSARQAKPRSRQYQSASETACPGESIAGGGGGTRRSAPGGVEGKELREQSEHVVLPRDVPTDRLGPPSRNSNGGRLAHRDAAAAVLAAVASVHQPVVGAGRGHGEQTPVDRGGFVPHRPQRPRVAVHAVGLGAQELAEPRRLFGAHARPPAARSDRSTAACN